MIKVPFKVVPCCIRTKSKASHLLKRPSCKREKNLGASYLREAAENINKLQYLATEIERPLQWRSIRVGGRTRAGSSLSAAGCWNAVWGAELPEQLRPAVRGNFQAGRSGASRWHCEVAQEEHPSIPAASAASASRVEPADRPQTFYYCHSLQPLPLSPRPHPAPPSLEMKSAVISMSGKEKQECTKMWLILRKRSLPLPLSPSPSPHKKFTSTTRIRRIFPPSEMEHPLFLCFSEDVRHQFYLLFCTLRKNQTHLYETSPGPEAPALALACRVASCCSFSYFPSGRVSLLQLPKGEAVFYLPCSTAEHHGDLIFPCLETSPL